LWETLESPSGSSFSSGHTTNTTALAVGLALVVGRLYPRFATLAMATAVAWAVTIAVSRMVLVVHWPTDVLVAFCIGVLVSLSVRFALNHYKQTTF
jgi:undecaprenyl-diphosphatase